MAQAEIKAVITAQDRASPTLKSFGSSVASITAGVTLGNLATRAITSSFGALKDVVSSSISSFNESAAVTAQLDAVLRSTNNAAGMTKDELIKLSSELEKQTTFSDEAILSAENLLLTFTKIGKEVIPDATKTILDMSTALGQDTKSSAVQLGKALNDPIEGITALRRVGVTFNEQQREQIQTLVESGKQLEAQKLILKELATEFGGSASAQAQTFEGRLKQLNNQIDNMKERIGEAVIKGITPFVEKLTTFFNSPEGQKWLDGVTASIDKFFIWLNANGPTLMAILNGFGQVFLFIGHSIQGLIMTFRDLSNWLSNVIFKFGEFSSKVKNTPIIGGLFGKISSFLGFAEGGNFNAGQPMVVGERGPEIIIPSRSGSVVPNHAIGSGQSVQINYNGDIHVRSQQDIEEISRRVGRDVQLALQGGY